MLRGLFKSISSNMMGGDVATIEDNELVSEKLKADREALSGGARNVNNAINNALDLNTIVNADYKGIGQKALGVTKNYLNTYGSDPNQPLQTQQTQQLHRAIIQEAQNSIETTLGKKSADLTIGSGLKGESLAQAGQNTKADIISGKKAPGFFEGIAGFVGDFARSEAGTTLLSGIAGQAVGREFGISDTAGFLQGASGGQAQIKQQKSLAVAADKLKKAQEVQNEKLKIARDALKFKGRAYRDEDVQSSGQIFIQQIDTTSPEAARKGIKNIYKRLQASDLEPWEKSRITDKLSKKAFGGSMDRLLASVAGME